MSKNLFRRGPVWWGRFQVADREYRRSLRTGDRAEARRRLKKWRDEVIANAHFGIVSHIWQESVIAWAEHDTEGLKPSVRERYASSLRTVDPIFADLPVAEIGRQQLAKVAARKGVTNATKKRDITAVMAVLYGAEARGWIETAPDPKPVLRGIRERRDPITLPLEHEVEQLINRCRGNLGRLVRILRLTGMRLEETASLQHRQIDLSRRVITLDRTKTDRARAVPLSDAAVGTLAGTPAYLRSPWVFWHGPGDRYVNVSSQLAAVKRRLGLQWRSHDLRHLFAVSYLQGEGSIYDLQRILGHASIKTTEIYLAYLTPEEQRVTKCVQGEQR